MHLLHTADLDDVGACAAHIGAHRVQEVGHVHDVRLLGHVLQHGHAFRHHRRQHGVDGGAHRHGVEKDMVAFQALGLHIDHAAAHGVFRAQSGEGLEMLVDGAGAQIAAAGHRHRGGAEPAQQRAQEIVAGAHLAAELVGHFGAGDAGGVDLEGVCIQHLHLCAHLVQNVHRGRHIADVGQVFDHAGTARQQRGRQNGNGCVFGAADGYLAHEGLSAGNHKFIQDPILPFEQEIYAMGRGP